MNLQTINFLLKKTKKDYAELAEIFSHTRKYLWKDLKEFDQYIKDDDTILDLGCGNGRLFELFNNKKIDYIGIDNCEELIKIAKEKYQSTNATFLVGDAINLPFKNEKFNAIFCIAVLNHIPSKKLQIKVLKNIKKILKKDGVLIMTNWNFYQKKYFSLIIKSFFFSLFSKAPLIKSLSQACHGRIRGFLNKLNPLSLPDIHQKDLKENLDFGDLLIPWKLKDSSCCGMNKIVHRYYHAFLIQELSQLFKQTGFEIIEKYYTKKGEKTNWWNGYNLVFVVKNN
ncbi:hypothetical protein CVV26_00015 [Candidatus Kuenenbacteria bacterium HGW-Kuenenbacteria-1]|uniref:Methyltransferase domain-containing protein n=1 Tax=Candidatus Kuenenbacteria bacterium HGW-Kuenenbacteria-1 TaxID=2013812 RepID=A0A2N1UP25_9BACT|nr:MAG: hypothetical protein CVV26_00015 [Candidatus Kuenenbacteria bacterium HGW-Kuenenbacteria-1]